MQLNELNTTKEKNKKNSGTGTHFTYNNYLGPKHFMITSEIIECRIRSGFAIMYAVSGVCVIADRLRCRTTTVRTMRLTGARRRRR